MNARIFRRSPSLLLVLAGSGHSLAQCLPLPSALDGTNGFVLRGIAHPTSSGFSVSSAGDFNGDGIDDIIIGGPFDSSWRFYAGASYVVFGEPNVGAGGSIDLSTLDGTNGIMPIGVDVDDFSGWSVSSAGDVNGDGMDDLIIGAPSRYLGSYFLGESGKSYVVFGEPGVGAGGWLYLSTLNGTNGFVLNGVDADGLCGFSVSSASDVNADGVDDLIIGAPSYFYSGISGESYVVFGDAGIGAGGSLDLATLNGTNGFTLNGIGMNDYSGRSVSSAGDINGDGVDDLIIGAPFAGAGQSYVVFGGPGLGASGSLDLATLDGTNGFVINGIDTNDFSGCSVASAGDVNGDGVDDIIIGACYASPGGRSFAGESYVVFGAAGIGAGGSLDLSTLNGTNGFVINGIAAGDQSGRSVSSAGDVNGDGVDDIIIGASNADPNGVDRAGESYVVLGAPGLGASGALELSSLDGTNGLILRGLGSRAHNGRSVSSAGDVNDDGFDDVIIGAPFADLYGQSGEGESCVLFGRPFPYLPPPLGAFAPVSPPDGATCIDVGSSLEWFQSIGAEEYLIEIDTDSAFANPIVSSIVPYPTTSITLPEVLSANTQYFWRVTAEKCGGSRLSEPPFFTFTTAQLPGPFALASPANGTIGLGTGPLLEWTESLDADQYVVEIDITPTFDSGFFPFSSIVPSLDTSIDLRDGTLSYATQYFWRVTAENCSSFSEPGQPPYFTFNTAPPPPGQFALISPVNGATEVERGPIVVWTQSTDADQYLVEIDTSSEFPDPVISVIVSSPSTSLDLADASLAFGTHYYCRVTAENTVEGFGTSTRPSTPALTSFTTLPTCRGDLDGDRDTDVFDFVLFVTAFGTTPADPNWNSAADLYADGFVNVLDFSYFAADFGCNLN